MAIANKLNGLSLDQCNMLLAALDKIKIFGSGSIAKDKQENKDYLINQLVEIRAYLIAERDAFK